MSFCHRHAAQLGALLATRSTQTNEVNRCAALLPALAHAAPWRVQRLRAALAIAREQPPRIVRGDGRVLIGKLAANGDAQAHPVVWHSLVLAYTYESEQRALTSAIDAVGATTDLTWIYLEVPAQTPGLPAPDVMHDGERSDNCALVAVSYRAGRRTVRQLASADAHVARMSWIA